MERGSVVRSRWLLAMSSAVALAKRTAVIRRPYSLCFEPESKAAGASLHDRDDVPVGGVVRDREVAAVGAEGELRRSPTGRPGLGSVTRRPSACRTGGPCRRVPTASVRSSGLSASAEMRSPTPRTTPIGRRAAEQRGEQVAARLRRVVERDALAREQQRAVELDRRAARGRRAAARRRRSPGRARCRAARARRRPATTASTSSAGDAGEHARAGGAASGSLAARLSSRNARSTSSSSGSWPAAQSSAAASRAPR